MRKQLYEKLVPGAIKKRFKSYYKKVFLADHKALYTNYANRVGQFELEEKHIKHLKPLLSRGQLLENLPKNAIVAEIGVDYGAFSEEIIKTCKPKKLHLIDAWSTDRYNKNKEKDVKQKFAKEIQNEYISIDIGYSTEVVKNFDDAYFDWVYIDTDHSYKTTLAELRSYSKKVKKGGIMAGHDFIIGNWNGLVRYGVIDAVYQFCKEENWELIYLTMEHKAHPSFAIREIQ